MPVTINSEQIRRYRLVAHHLDAKRPAADLLEIAGACGLQNTPPGAWQTAAFNRVKDCSLALLEQALYEEKSLVQAWSFRGAPVVFPAGLADIFLSPLLAKEGEWPWVYTLGITGALDTLQMPFDELLARTKNAAKYLDTHTILSKDTLDGTLADIIQKDLPPDKLALWRSPSMYAKPGRQTVGQAAVSFLLRPCSFSSLVVFAKREGATPSFTSFSNWTGQLPPKIPDAEKTLARKFLHCYGPATPKDFMSWLGSSKKQADRLWRTIADEISPVLVDGKTRYMLACDIPALTKNGKDDERLLLLGPHDPYLDIRDRGVILPDSALHKEVWKYVGNPGAVVKSGQIIGIWRTKTVKNDLEIAITLWEAPTSQTQEILKNRAEEYAIFRGLRLKSLILS